VKASVPDDTMSVVITHLSAQDRAEKLAASFRERGRKAEIRRIGPVLGIHLGIGSLGISWIAPEDST